MSESVTSPSGVPSGLSLGAVPGMVIQRTECLGSPSSSSARPVPYARSTTTQTYPMKDCQRLQAQPSGSNSLTSPGPLHISSSEDSGALLHETIYKPSKPWAWTCNATLMDVRRHAMIAKTKRYSTHISTGKIGDKHVTFVEKTWSTSSSLDKSFFSELALHKTRLRKLRNLVSPIMGVFASPHGITVAMEVPHRVFWIEASKDMPKVLKKKCIEALQKLHDHGVCYRNLSLSKIWIGADAKVLFTDLHDGRSIEPNSAVFLRRARQVDMEGEMQKLKVLLDYDGAHNTERRRFVASATTFERPTDPAFPREDWFEDTQRDHRLFINPNVDMGTLHDAMTNFHRIIGEISLDGPVSEGDGMNRRDAPSPPPPGVVSYTTPSALGKHQRSRSPSPTTSPKRRRARSQAPSPLFHSLPESQAADTVRGKHTDHLWSIQTNFNEGTPNSTDHSSRLCPTNVRDKEAQNDQHVPKRVQHLLRRESAETEPSGWKPRLGRDNGTERNEDHPLGYVIPLDAIRPAKTELAMGTSVRNEDPKRHPSANGDCINQGIIDLLLDSPCNRDQHIHAQRVSFGSSYGQRPNRVQSRRKARQKLVASACRAPIYLGARSGLLGWVASWFGFSW
ncbi:hypothetical protein BDN72DRAFT_830091 [Pluteus cervinus]|uniref:Uncharacterized protein n=1 Tax=Pluteus cervinus TaxID=181527 RepID=A0ACD3BGX7_9AGAR|nr:hypothetical protein BDN72DRAFT_830091 [Pluteus cervinus]